METYRIKFERMISCDGILEIEAVDPEDALRQAQELGDSDVNYTPNYRHNDDWTTCLADGAGDDPEILRRSSGN